jgi:hypothetical protein
MNNQRTVLGKYYLTLFFFFFLAIDCWFLYHGKYGSRLYSKPALALFLLLWFISNTAFNIRSSPHTLSARMCLYAALGFIWVSDICGLWSTLFIWTACLLLYSGSYILYFFLFLSIQQNAIETKEGSIYTKKSLPITIITLLLGCTFVYILIGFDAIFYHWFLYAHIVVVAAVVGCVANMWSIKVLQSIRPLFAIGVFFLILTNVAYALDEIYFNRTRPSIDVLVALFNGLSMLFIVFGTIKFIRLKRE